MEPRHSCPYRTEQRRASGELVLAPLRGLPPPACRLGRHDCDGCDTRSRVESYLGRNRNGACSPSSQQDSEEEADNAITSNSWSSLGLCPNDSLLSLPWLSLSNQRDPEYYASRGTEGVQ